MLGKALSQTLHESGIVWEPVTEICRSKKRKENGLLIHMAESPVSKHDYSEMGAHIERSALICSLFDQVLYVSSLTVKKFLDRVVTTANEYIARKIASEGIYRSNHKNLIVRLPTLVDPYALRGGTLLAKIKGSINREDACKLEFPESLVNIADLTDSCITLQDLAIRIMNGEKLGAVVNASSCKVMKAGLIMKVCKLLKESEVAARTLFDNSVVDVDNDEGTVLINTDLFLLLKKAVLENG